MEKKMQPRTIVMVDMDGIVSDFYFPATTLMQQWYNTSKGPVRGKDATSWGFAEFGVSEEKEGEFWTRLSKEENFWLNLPEIEEGIVAKLYDHIGNLEGVTIYFVTTRQGTEGMTVEDQSAQWLINNGWDGIPHVIVTKHKGLIAKALKAQYFIDDKASNVTDVLKDSPNTHSFFLLRKYQENELDEVMRVQGEMNANLTVCRSLESFVLAIEHGA